MTIRDSRSGQAIIEALDDVVFSETGRRICYEGNKSAFSSNTTSSRKVYFCDSLSAYAYHSSMSCDGLQIVDMIFIASVKAEPETVN